MSDQRPDLLPPSSRDPKAGNGLFLVAMVLIAAAMVLGPVVVLTKSSVLLNSAIALGLIGVGCVVIAAIRSYTS